MTQVSQENRLNHRGYATPWVDWVFTLGQIAPRHLLPEKVSHFTQFAFKGVNTRDQAGIGPLGARAAPTPSFQSLG